MAGATPWSKIHRPGISLPVFYAISEDWQLGFTPAIEFSGESGVEPDEAFTYGGVLSLMHPVNKNLFLGIGFGIFNRLEKLEVFPFIVINWKMKLPAVSGGVSSGTRRRSNELCRAKLRRSQPVFALVSFRFRQDFDATGRRGSPRHLVGSSCPVVAE